MSSDIITVKPTELNLANLPDEIIPYDWLDKGYYCAPFVVRIDNDTGKESGIQVKGFASQNTVEGFKLELINRISELGYALRIHTQKTFVRCQGMINIDIDVKGGKQGIESWKALKEGYALTDSTLVVQTGSGGRHHYYKIPEGGDAVVSTVNWNDKTTKQVFDGIDIRSGNTVLVAPMRPDGEKWGGYQVISGTIPAISDLPVLSATLYAAMTPLKTYAKGFHDSLGEDLGVLASPQGTVTEGSRNQSLYRYACTLIGQGTSEEDVYSACYTYNEQKFTPPLNIPEVDSTVASAWSSHADRPKEKLLREIRRRFVQWAEEKSQAIIDLDDHPSSAIKDISIFRSYMGDDLKLPAQEFYTEEELEHMSPSQKRKMVSVFDYAVAKRLLKDVKQIGYRPGAGYVCPVDAVGALLNPGQKCRMMYNTYRAPKINSKGFTYSESAEYISDFLAVVKHICGDNQSDADLFLDWCGYVVQNPRERVHYAPYFSNVQGSGRGTIMQYLHMVIGEDNTARVSQSDIGAKFNTITCMKRLIMVDEMFEAPLSPKDEQIFLGAFNSMVTEPYSLMEEKLRRQVKVENYAVVMLVSNFITSINLKSTDRRIMPFVNFDTTHKPPEEVYTRLGQRIKNGSAGVEEAKDLSLYVSHIHNYLSKRPVAHVKSGGHAPRTSHVKGTLEANKNPLSVLLERDILNRRGIFAADVVTMEAITAHLMIFHPGLEKGAERKLTKMWATSLVPKDDQIMCRIQAMDTAVKRLIPHHTINARDLDKFNGDPTIRFENTLILHNPPAMFSVRNHEHWRNASDADILSEYMKLHGVNVTASTFSSDEVRKLRSTVVDINAKRA